MGCSCAFDCIPSSFFRPSSHSLNFLRPISLYRIPLHFASISFVHCFRFLIIPHIPNTTIIGQKMPAWFARIFRSTPKLGSMKYAATQVDLHRDMMSSRNPRKRRPSSGESFYSHDAAPIRLHIASRNAQFMSPLAQAQVPGWKPQRANSSASQYIRTRTTSAPAPPGLPRSRFDTMPPVPTLSPAPKRLPKLPPLMQPSVQPFLTRTPARRGAADWLPVKKCRVCEFDNPVTDFAGPNIPCTHVHLGFPCHGTYRVTERDVVKRRELLKQLEHQCQPRFGY